MVLCTSVVSAAWVRGVGGTARAVKSDVSESIRSNVKGKGRAKPYREAKPSAVTVATTVVLTSSETPEST